MKSSMKHWKQLVLLGMLAWVLLFLALFTYFMDSHVSNSWSLAAISHTEARRLVSLQGRPRAIMGSQPDTTVGEPGPRPGLEPSPGTEESPEVTDGKAYQELQTPGWQPALNEDGPGPGSQGASQEQERMTWSTTGQRQEEEEQERDAQQDSHGVDQRWHRFDDQEDYYFSKSKAVVRNLWKGSVSSSMLSPRLQKAMRDYMNANKHHVAYRGRRHTKRSVPELLCQLKTQVQIRVLDGTEEPFYQLGWHKLVPHRPLEQLFDSKFHTCAVVTSAGAILHSSLGKEIDSHEAVLRFNTAPTEGYQKDVGNKTTIRIINSQILANPKHQFNTSALYRDVTLVAWDPAPYVVNLQKWYQSPDYDLFRPYVDHRKKKPNQPFYILHPKFIWQLWDIIQGNTQEMIQPNPPSSGFIGIILMMALCEEVHVYEYIPSLRQTDLCHYHEQYYDAACTLGAYHPLLYEKMLIGRLNRGSEHDLQRKGRITLPGLSTVTCDP